MHRLAGRPLLNHVLACAADLGPQKTVVVVGHGAEVIRAAYPDAQWTWALQEPQRGTGHAVLQAVPHLDSTAATTVVLNGDVPLLRSQSVQALVNACQGQVLALLTVTLDDPTGYGRILRDERGRVRGIVEHKDASAEQLRIREVYTGTLAAPTGHLCQWVRALRSDNAQQEYYLTDIVAMAVAQGMEVSAVQPHDATEVLGINSPAQLADLERRYQVIQAQQLMDAGVRLSDPARLDVRGQLRCGQDVEIDINCIFEGHVELGDNVRVGAHCFVRNARIHSGAVLQPYTHVDGDDTGVTVGAMARVGPFARLRAGAELGQDVHVGNFVEVKNSTLGNGAKANHLAYLGDATVGARVNYGAGSITANYDGVNKHRTVIGDDALVGSNCVLIAPVTIGAGATIGGGSTVSKDVPAGQLTVARARQTSLSHWQRPSKKPPKG